MTACQHCVVCLRKCVFAGGPGSAYAQEGTNVDIGAPPKLEVNPKAVPTASATDSDVLIRYYPSRSCSKFDANLFDAIGFAMDSSLVVAPLLARADAILIDGFLSI